MSTMTPTPETLRELFYKLAHLSPGFGPMEMGPILSEVNAAADAWDFDKARANLFKRERDDAEAKVDRIANGIAALGEENAELRKSHEVMRSGIRSLWHGVVDGDMDKLSVGYALKELFR